MKYVCLIHHHETTLATMPKVESDALRGSYVAFTQSIIDGGQLVAGEALQPTHTATTVRVRRGKLTTTAGPVVETREQVGGFLEDPGAAAVKVMRVIDALYRTESRGVLASLIRLLRDFDLAEEALLGPAPVDQAPRRQRP